jgi:hypothetical protein
LQPAFQANFHIIFPHFMPSFLTAFSMPYNGIKECCWELGSWVNKKSMALAKALSYALLCGLASCPKKTSQKDGQQQQPALFEVDGRRSTYSNPE